MKVFRHAVRFKLGKSQADADRVIRLMLPYAYRTVPVYRDFIRRRYVDLSTARTAVVLANLPIVSKEDMTSTRKTGPEKGAGLMDINFL
jgi:phenylacetate-coenzyme A ligase PaaK-like adenylate-forming protein